MSAFPSNLTLAQATPQPAPRGAVWIDTACAADRLGVSVRRAVQLCRKWSEVGTARRDGGKWVVREDADPQLGRVLFPDVMREQFSWGTLTHAQRTELMRREAIVKGWGPAREASFRAGLTVEKATIAYCDRMSAQHKITLSASRLYAWYRAWRAEGVAGLVDQRWKESDKADDDDAFLSEAKRWYLMPHKRYSKRDCWVMAQVEANRLGWPVRSYGAVKRFLAKVPLSTAIMRREGAEAFTNECEPFGERDYTSINSNDFWNADHHIFDVIVRGPNGKLSRPWLTAWQDVRSRRIVGWGIRCADPNSDTIIEAWRQAVLVHGVPQNALMDNGRDFKAQAFAGGGRGGRGVRGVRGRKLSIDNDAPRVTSILERLGVEKVLAKPYHPQSKPIERFFRTVEEQFGAWWATYTSGSTETKPESLAGNLKKDKAPSLEEFISAFTRWLDVGYDRKPHFGDGMSGKTPAAVFDDCLVEKRTTTREALDVLCLKPTKPIRVTQNGVRIDGMTFYDLDLVATRLGQLVTLRVDGRDLASGVQVFEAETDRFICIAMPARKMPWGATAQEFREAQTIKSKNRRKVREFIEEVRPRAGEDVMDIMLQGRAIIARQAEASAPPTSPDGGMVIRPVRSSIDDQLPAIRKAQNNQKHRQAAGAESLSLQDVGALIRSQGRQAQEASTVDPLFELAGACRAAEQRGE